MSNNGLTSTPSERLKYLVARLGYTQLQFANKIGIDPANMSKMINGRTRLTAKMMDRIVAATGVNLEWLMYGTEAPFDTDGIPAEAADAEAVADTAADGTLTVLTPENVPPLPGQGAPIYDIDVTAGVAPLSTMFTVDRIAGYLNIPGVTNDHPIVRVSGNSMEPRINNGSFIQIRPISENSRTIFWGSTYVVVMDDYRLVKVIRRHQDPDKVILHSYNPAYDDMEVPLADIRKLYYVEAIFNYDVMS